MARGLTEFFHSPLFFGAFAAVKSSRVPVKQTRHAETEQGNAGGEIFLPLATMLRPCLGGNHRL